MNNSTPTPIVLKPMMEKIIIAACKYFGYSEEELLSGKSLDVVHARKICFYLVKQNVFISNLKIAKRFNLKGDSTVTRHIDDIEAQKNIYARIMHDLQTVLTIANNLDIQFTTHGMDTK